MVIALCTIAIGIGSILLIVPFLTGQTLENVVNGKHRSAKNKARDQYRNPIETLNFFGIKNDTTKGI